jgi:hypothetical protein
MKGSRRPTVEPCVHLIRTAARGRRLYGSQDIALKEEMKPNSWLQLHDGEDGAEHLFLGQGVAFLDVGEDGRFDEVTFVVSAAGEAVAAAEGFAVFFAGDGDVFEAGFELAFVDDGEFDEVLTESDRQALRTSDGYFRTGGRGIATSPAPELRAADVRDAGTRRCRCGMTGAPGSTIVEL